MRNPKKFSDPETIQQPLSHWVVPKYPKDPAMPPNQSAKDIFLAALELTTEERGNYLQQACANDFKLRARVVELLAAADDPDSRLDRPAAAISLAETSGAHHLTEKAGTLIGPYKLLEQIGEGGMGVVYMAEQQEPVTRQVAVKIIKPGMDTRQVIARFEAERQALAMMDHPNIAKVLDAGATATGRPYFAMELVRGIPITDFCDRNKLPAKERLELFVPVAEAIQSAHHKGIIHRDIKPSNVLVTLQHSRPFPKVIDFGVAKAINKKLTEKTLFTSFASMIGTPAYMSPEQAEMTSLDIDTRSDVYSLGVLLYELLTGSTPFSDQMLRSVAYGEMQNIIVNEEPQKPSTRVSSLQGDERSTLATKRGTSVASFSSELKGDLDWIVMKCLEKDRRRRYETPSALAADIKRHLDSEPVLAAAPTLSYQLKKLYERHAKAVWLTGAIAACLVAATIVSATFGVVARNALNRAELNRQKAQNAQRREREEREQAEIAATNEKEARLQVQAQSASLAQLTEQQRLQLYAADMYRADRNLADGNLDLARGLLMKQVPASGEIELRGLEWHFIKSRCVGQELWSAKNDYSRDIATSPCGRFWAYHAGNEVLVRSQNRPWNVVHSIPASASGLSFCGNGELLALNTKDGIRVWETKNWTIQKSFPSGASPVRFSRDNKWLAFRFGEDLQLISVADWSVAQSLRMSDVANPFFERDSIDFSRDGKYLVFPGARGKFVFFDLSRQTIVDRWKDKVPVGFGVTFSPDAKRLFVSGMEAAEIEVWNLSDDGASLDLQLLGALAPVTRIEFMEDGKHFISAGLDEMVSVWDAATMRHVRFLKGHVGEIWSLAPLANPKTLISSALADESGIRLWSIERPESEPGESPGFPLGFLQDGNLLRAVPTLFRRIKLESTDLRTGDSAKLDVDADLRMDSIPQSSRLKPAVALSCDGIHLAVATNDNRVLAFDMTKGKVVRTLQLDNDGKSPSVISFHPSRPEVLAVGSTSGAVCLCDIKTAKVSPFLSGSGEGGVDGLSLSPHNLIAVSRKRLKVYSLDNPNNEIFGFNDKRCHCVEFSPDGSSLALGVMHGGVEVFDCDTGSPLGSLDGPRAGTDSICFSPDGRTLIAASNDLSIRFFNLETRMEMISINGPSLPTLHLKKLASDHFLVVGSRGHKFGTKSYRIPISYLSK